MILWGEIFYFIAVFAGGIITGWLMREIKVDKEKSDIIEDYEGQLSTKERSKDFLLKFIIDNKLDEKLLSIIDPSAISKYKEIGKEGASNV